MHREFHIPYITRRSFMNRFGTLALGTTVLSRTIRELSFLNNAMAAAPDANDYKALVCIFLNGGNDSNNMIIPTLPEEWDSYSKVRGPVLAIPNTDGGPATALAMNSRNGTGSFPASDGRTYGFHPAMPEIKNLFNLGKIAPVLNVGTLSFPLTKTQYSARSVPRPPQLFSHSDQQTQWQTSIPDQPPLSGWGGRLADLLSSPDINAGGRVSMAVTLAGSNIFEVGNVNASPQYAVTTSGAVTLSSSITGARKTALQSILTHNKGSSDLQTKAYAQVYDHSINQAEILTAALTTNASAPWISNFNTSITTPNGGTAFTSGLMSQMRMVARMIHLGSQAASTGPVETGGLGMRRQIFFIQVGGYDTHTNQTNNSGATTPDPAKVILGSHANLMAELSKSMNALYQAVSQMGTHTASGKPMVDCVTAFTASDFSRTFPANGFGSDHGWGGHQLVMGGAVKGGATYGTFPTLAVNGPDDTGIGRWIPTTAVDQYAATIASWFGVDDAGLQVVVPNLGRFASPNLGFL